MLVINTENQIMQKLIPTLISLALIFSFQSMASEEQRIAYQEWKDYRLEKLQQPHGWLSLVGLEWLKVGENRMGAATDNDIILAHGPDYIGSFWLDQNQGIKFSPNKDASVLANDLPVEDMIKVHADTSEEETTVFTIGTFLFHAIEREKMAIRIKDSKAETRTGFVGLEYFPEEVKFRIDADFIPYEPAKIIPTVNVLGILTNEPSPGRLEFSIDGVEYSLDALDSDEDYYMIFADKTNGRTTYGPGRFVYTDGKVNEQGKVRIDFNKAYNPPCAFTAYSTCTLPPLQNRLRVEINAGEKKYANSVY